MAERWDAGVVPEVGMVSKVGPEVRAAMVSAAERPGRTEERLGASSAGEHVGRLRRIGAASWESVRTPHSAWEPKITIGP